MEFIFILGGLLVLWLFTSTTKSDDIKRAIKLTKEATDGVHNFLEDVNDSLDELNEKLENSLAENYKKILIDKSKEENIDSLNEHRERLGLDRYDDVTDIVNYFKKRDRYNEISHLVIRQVKPKGLFKTSNNEKYFINREYGRLIRNRATIEKVAKENAAKEKAERLLAERQRAERERAERERAERERAERERAERELAERELAEREQTEREQAEREQAERERTERERTERERTERERTERERAETEQTETLSLKSLKSKVTPADLANKVDDYLINFLKIRFYLSGSIEYPKLNCINDYFSHKFPGLATVYYTEIWEEIIRTINLDYSKLKNINALYHFTHKSNLASILELGILTRKNLDDRHLRYAFNDQLRLDGVLDSISLSFSHPNFKMFYKYRKQTGDNNWVVLKISPSILYGREGSTSNDILNFNYLNKAVYCSTNAASMKMKNLSRHERMTCEAFLNMFESPIGMSLPTYTYDNQAEILYLDNIPIDFIEEIYTNYHDDELNWVRSLGYSVTANDVVFDKRRYRDG